MMDCQRVRQLLPLWIGRDLPDASSAAEVAVHLGNCTECERHRSGLQSSLDVLQASSSVTLSEQPGRSGLWPKLAVRISQWELTRPRDRFNGWIPASVMAMAVALMVAVSIPSIHQEFFGDGSKDWNSANLFESEPRFSPVAETDRTTSQNRPAFQTPVNLKSHQW